VLGGQLGYARQLKKTKKTEAAPAPRASLPGPC